MHEVFLCRVAAHPVLRKDLNFHVFLEYNQDVSNANHNSHLLLADARPVQHVADHRVVLVRNVTRSHVFIKTESNMFMLALAFVSFSLVCQSFLLPN